MYLAENLKLLRSHKELSQQKMAELLFITRNNLSKYENGKHDPPLDVIIRMSRYFKISIDALLTIRLTKSQLDNYSKTLATSNLIIPIQVDSGNNDLIEIIPEQASAGYSHSYGDAEYIESLDSMVIPFLNKYGKCRAFPISGDSMLPIQDGSYVIGSQVVSLNRIKKRETIYHFIQR